MKNKKDLATWFATNSGYTVGANNRFSFMQKLIGMGLKVDRGFISKN